VAPNGSYSYSAPPGADPAAYYIMVSP